VANARPQVVRAAEPHGACAQRAAELVERVAAQRGRVRLAVTGGSAARAVESCFERLGARGFDFARLRLTWIDERCVGLDAPESNAGTLRLPPGIGGVLRLFEGGEDPPAAVARVERALARDFDGALDVTILGLGPDGHIASLFVGRPDPPGRVAFVADSPKPPARRITLTRAFLATAAHALLAACGEHKRAALERLAAGDPRLPASGLRGLELFTDLELEVAG
jgi:6-phosphogluconolactonase